MSLITNLPISNTLQTSILNAASILGRCTTGLLAPYLGVLNLGTFTTFGTGIIIFCMLALRDKTSTILFAIFFGFFSGAQIASAPAMAGEYSRSFYFNMLY